MNRSVIFTQGSDNVKPNLTVAAQTSDIRVVSENEEKTVKQRGFRKMAKDSTSTTSGRGRPARRIKLNRSIFNADNATKPTFHVKTLSEIKSGKEALTVSVTSSTAESTGIEDSVVDDSSSAASASPMPARSVINSPSFTDRRTVIKRENTKSLLVPAIKLKRISNYTRSSINSRSLYNPTQAAQTVVKKETGDGTQPKEVPRLTIRTHHPHASPMKKRKVSPLRLSISKQQITSPLKKPKFSPIRSPEAQAATATGKPPSPPLPSSTPSPSMPLDDPPSPALSLGVQSDDDLDSTRVTPASFENSRVIVINEKCCITGRKQKTKPVPKDRQNDVHSRLGRHPQSMKIHTSHASSSPSNMTDDRLDVISVIADDDELFLDSKPNGPLKHSLSQDSIFNMSEETSNRGNIRSLAKKVSKKSRDDLITSKPISNNYRIPRHNSHGKEASNGNARKTSDKRTTAEETSESCISRATNPRNDFFQGQLPHFPPKPTRISNAGLPVNVEEKIRTVQRHLRCKNISEAWSSIKELDEKNCPVDVRLLEDAMKCCDAVSMKKASPVLAEIILGIFAMLTSREALKPVTYIYTIEILCRCGSIQKAFEHMAEMIEAKAFPPQEVLLHLVKNLLKFLQDSPKWIFELLQNIQNFNFANPSLLFSTCLSSLAATPADALHQITMSQWDSLIALVCSQADSSGGTLLYKLIEKHHIAMSDQSSTKLLHLFQESKCTKQRLDLLHFTNQTFDLDATFDDQRLNIRDVEAHITDLINAGIVPREDILRRFIEKASAMREFSAIYRTFQRYQLSPLGLSLTALKIMLEALENWDENIKASIEVYSALREAKTGPARNGKAAPPAPGIVPPQKPLPKGQCFTFLRTGRCIRGDKCRFSHNVEDMARLHRQNSDERNRMAELQKAEVSEAKQHHNPNIPAEFPNTTASRTMVNGVGHGPPIFPSFQPPSFLLPMFNSIRQPVAPNQSSLWANHNPGFRPTEPARRPQARPPRHAFVQDMSAPHKPRFTLPNVPLRVPFIGKEFQPLADAKTAKKLNRSFSWEPGTNSRPNHRISPLPSFQSPGSDKNNNSQGASEFQQRVERSLASKAWKDVHQCYMEAKRANKSVHASDLKIFRSVFTKDVSTVGSNFSELVNIIHTEDGSVKSSNSDPDHVLDQYDLEFLGSLGVSLMEKCLVTKKFDRGYEILHALHAHSISYFECGKNFGAYTRDIPPSAVAIIAVKLCMGVPSEDALLGAVEVLRASNYAMPEQEDTTENVEYRIKVLQQLFMQLFDQGDISEAYEVLQHLNASPNVVLPLYAKILLHYSDCDDFDQSFEVVSEMQEQGLDLNTAACQALYEKFLKLCLTNQQDDEALIALNEMEMRDISLKRHTWKETLNYAQQSTSEILSSKLFQKCLQLGVFPETFDKETPWLCQLGCGYSQLEIKLLIVRHLKQLQQNVGSLSISSVKDFQITLYPRVSDSNLSQKFDQGIQTAISQNSSIVAKVLEEDLNPPLKISDQKEEQFHSKFTVDAMSLFRWFSANNQEQETDENEGDDGDASSRASLESFVSRMTRFTEFD